MQEVATILAPESQNWTSLVNGGVPNSGSLSSSMVTSLQSSIGGTEGSGSPRLSEASSSGFPSIRRTPAVEINEQKLSNELTETDVESLLTSLSQFSLLQQEAPQFSGNQWPSGDINSMYGGNLSSLSDPNIAANLAAQFQALSRSQQQQQQQHQLPLQLLQQQQLRAITGFQLDSPGLQTLQQRQPLTNASSNYMGSATYNGATGNAGLNGWGSLNGFGYLPQQQPLQRNGSQHNRSLSVQNINMSGSANGVNQLNGAFGRFPGTITSGSSGIAAQGNARYSNGKSFVDQPQFGKSNSSAYGQNTADLLKNLSLYQSQHKSNGQQTLGMDSQWLDLMRYSQDGLQQHTDTNNLLDVNSLNIGHWDSKSVQNRGVSYPYGYTDLSDAVLGHSLSAGLKLSPTTLSPVGASNDTNEIFSRKVFVGGLPPDIDEDEIMVAFRRVGHVTVDWPHKAESKSYFPPKGYCFLLFQDELSVQLLVESCKAEDGKLYWGVSSPTMKDKLVQIRPWRLDDSDFVMDGTQPLDPRKTVFVGGVPRPLRAVELAVIMGRLYGSVCYAGIDTDPELKYPKGAGRVAFSSQQSYIAAISARFVQLQHGDIDKRVEVKPYVLDDQICDECQGVLSGGKYAPYFCANVTCLQYYCEACWSTIHSTPGREFHKPLMKEGSDRPRAMPRRL